MYHGKITKARKKRKYAIGRPVIETIIGEESRRAISTKGKGVKIRVTKAKYVNVNDKGKNTRCEIVSLVENKADKDYVRRNIITKGAVLNVKTPDGNEVKVMVTSRPGQTGTLNARPI